MATLSIAAKTSIDPPLRQNIWIILTLLAVAVATRASLIGDPAIDVDEEFYLLVADRMWHGALPYVDIWDRKPILLFLIYAALRPFSPAGIIAYQIGALLFAAATAFVIVLIAKRFANLRGAWLAGVSYLLYLPIIGGEGGQSPVFYNLFMALGALEVLRAHEARGAASISRHGLFAMIWVGLAIQVKYIAVIEGISFGLWLIILLLQQADRRFSRAAIQSAIWVAAALAPTFLALCFYGVIGHTQEFVQANFLSIFEKRQPVDFPAMESLQLSLTKLMPLLVVASLSSLLLFRRVSFVSPVAFLFFWTVFAIVGFFAVGNYYDHYALPLLVPMMAMCAPLLDLPIGGVAGVALFGWVFLKAAGILMIAQKQSDESRIEAMAAAIQPYAAKGCIYVNDGPSILYLLTHSCLPSRYVFPGHLNDAAEAPAVDATRNMAALLAARPAAVLVADRPTLQPRNRVTAAMLDAVLASSYQPVATLPDVFANREQILYARKDLLPPQ